MKIACKPGMIIVVVLLLASQVIACSSDEETPLVENTPMDTATSAVETMPAITLDPWTGNPTVQTVYGNVKGFEDESNTWAWKAVPFAKPPVGDLRWKAPRDPEPWDGVREETRFCSICAQFDPLMGEEVIGNEDCLYLNVWRPQSEETDLPVYFWIHGGGNAIGSANQTPTYFGSNLAQKSNMVFVSVNYRLGPFGWFTHPALGTGDAKDDSGNYGTLDLIKALEWIQENIEAFGGDPDKVIITGESAGAVNVLSLILSPLANGLFHRALVQSGMTSSTPVDVGVESASEVLSTLLVNDGTVANTAESQVHLDTLSNTEIQAYLRAKTPQEIFSCYEQRGFGMVNVTDILEDGTVIVAEGSSAFDTGTYPNKVPIMVGSNKEELKMFQFMNPFFEGKDELYQSVTNYGSDFWKVNGVDDLARKLSDYPAQPNVYAYQFNWGAGWDTGTSPIPEPYDLKIGSAHSLDVPFFLGNHSFNVFMTDWVFTEENRPGREELGEAMMAYVAQFTQTGNPNESGSNLPQWEPWANGANEPKCILFDADLNVAKIEMSTTELTAAGVLEAMKSELPEPLYSEVYKFLSSDWIVSGIAEDSG